MELADVRSFALTLPRAYEALVRDRVELRVRPLDFVPLSPLVAAACLDEGRHWQPRTLGARSARDT